jgi:DtxR family transcriptional regulator, Mn-dependent transcriptional regulator
VLSQQVEEYLEAVGKLEERGEAVTTTALARERGVSLPSATEMLQRLSEQGLIVYEQRKHAYLTPEGRRAASTVVRRHRLWERFLHDVLGLRWDQVHDEACKLEHATSPDVESRLASVLGDVATCPHGHTIPAGGGDIAREEVSPLTDLVAGQTATVVSVREDSALLRVLDALGVRPGATVRVIDSVDAGLTLEVAGRRRHLDRAVAQQVVARPLHGDESPAEALVCVPLTDLASDERALVREIRGGGPFVGRCLALGFTPGAEVRMVQNHRGGPLIAVVRDTRVALGRGEATRVRVVRDAGIA